jgi:hypothetical protein
LVCSSASRYRLLVWAFWPCLPPCSRGYIGCPPDFTIGAEACPFEPTAASLLASRQPVSTHTMILMILPILLHAQLCSFCMRPLSQAYVLPEWASSMVAPVPRRFVIGFLISCFAASPVPSPWHSVLPCQTASIPGWSTRCLASLTRSRQPSPGTTALTDRQTEFICILF